MNTSTGMRKPIHVLLIDDSVLTLHGLRTFLSKSNRIEIVGVAGTSTEAVAALRTHRPDVVVLEVQVGQESGIDLCRTIRASHPHIGVLFFTGQDDKHLLHSAILAGAQGYILKTASADAVAKSIEIVSTGQAIMDQQLIQHVMAWVRDGGWPVPKSVQDSYSKDDLQILSRVVSGKTNREIAQELDVEPTVVAARLQKLYKRLRISRRSEAARHYVHLEKDWYGQGTRSH